MNSTAITMYVQMHIILCIYNMYIHFLQLSDLSSAPIPLPDEIERRGPNAQDDSCCPKSLRLATPTRWRSKRVKFAYFLARARIVSKGLMVRYKNTTLHDTIRISKYCLGVVYI